MRARIFYRRLYYFRLLEVSIEGNYITHRVRTFVMFGKILNPLCLVNFVCCFHMHIFRLYVGDNVVIGTLLFECSWGKMPMGILYTGAFCPMRYVRHAPRPCKLLVLLK